MNKNVSQIYQIKISLLDTEPLIWRRILIPEDYNLEELHYVIQDSMGWDNSHLYEFISGTTRKAITEDSKIKNELTLKHPKLYYEYDFGDSWAHEVLLESIFPANSHAKYPVCTDGEMACPPEDCGGIPGYYHLLEIIKNPEHEEYRSMLEWLGNKFDPKKFDPKKVKFK